MPYTASALGKRARSPSSVRHRSFMSGQPRASSPLQSDGPGPSKLSFVTLVNDHEQFARCRASIERDGEESCSWIVVEPNALGLNAAQGLNRGLDKAASPWVAFCHQDILFPRGWTSRVTRSLSGLPDSAAVVGLVGTRADGRYRGHVVDPNGRCYWGPLPAEVLVLDEVVLILRREAGLRFDEDVPGFHCYGTDLCLRARSRGLGVVAVDAPVRHLSSGRIDAAYERSARWILERWGKEYQYIVPTPATIIQDLERSSFPRRMLFRWRRRQDRRKRHRIPRDAQVDGEL